VPLVGGFAGMRDREVLVDSIFEAPVGRAGFDAVLLIHVLCDTTMLVTAVSQGRRTLPVANPPCALRAAERLREPLLASGENATWRPGFDLSDSPAALARRTDRRPLVLSCAIGATLAEHALFWPQVYVACLRNLAATARHMAAVHERVLVLDAADDADVRCENQLAAGRIVRGLVEAGFEPAGIATRETLERWSSADVELLTWGRSAEDLRRRQRHEDVDFVLSHVDDLDLVCAVNEDRIEPPAAGAHGFARALA
jgi:phosphosulfolactate phosphohydrolase-like enzyme